MLTTCPVGLLPFDPLTLLDLNREGLETAVWSYRWAGSVSAKTWMTLSRPTPRTSGPGPGTRRGREDDGSHRRGPRMPLPSRMHLQQILGSCSPKGRSTIRLAPSLVFATTIPV